MRANYAACCSCKQDIASLSGLNGLFYSLYALRKKMALVCRNARNLSILGEISDRQGTSNSLLTIFKGSKTLNCEKKP